MVRSCGGLVAYRGVRSAASLRRLSVSGTVQQASCPVVGCVAACPPQHLWSDAVGRSGALSRQQVVIVSSVDRGRVG